MLEKGNIALPLKMNIHYLLSKFQTALFTFWHDDIEIDNDETLLVLVIFLEKLRVLLDFT